jgi:uncharacterized membrane protein
MTATIQPILGAGVITTLQQFVSTTKLHPILVNFTAALVPVSVASDLLGKFFNAESLRNTGWWTLFYAIVVTPFTAITGWLFWMSDDNGVTGMTIHKWLGTGLAILLFGLFAWRRHFHKIQKAPTIAYFILGVIFVTALAYQGHLGGEQVFSGM